MSPPDTEPSIEILPRFDSPRQRASWVKAQLELMGYSYAAIAGELGVSRSAVRAALFVPSARIEEAVAAKLGTTARQLFPERYDGGRRLHRQREDSGLAARVNNSPAEAA